jgi:trigger factor
MEITVGLAEGLNRELVVIIPAENVQSAYQQKFNKIKGNVQIDGFRSGKVPDRVIEQRHGASIHQEVVSDLLRDSVFPAIEQEKLQPAGMPSIDNVKAEKGQALEFTIKFEILPEITLKSFDGKTINTVEAALTDADLDAAIDKLRKQRATWVDANRASKKGDKVEMDFEGRCDGELIAGGTAKNASVILGEGQYLPDLEKGLIGMKVGEEKDIEVNFPEDYSAPMAGKKSLFHVKMHKVLLPELPEINDELAKAFGIEKGGVDAMKADIKKHMQVELENGIKMFNKNAILDQLLALHEVDVPAALVEAEMGQMNQYAQERTPKEKRTALTDDMRKHLRTPAERRVKLGLLMAEAVKQKKVDATDDEIKERIQRLAGSYQDLDKVVEWYMSDRERVSQIKAGLVEDKVVDLFLQEATAKPKTMSYDEIIATTQS